MSDDGDGWRSWDKVSPARTGQANDRRYKGERIEGTEALGECWWCSRPATRLCDTPLAERIEAEYVINGRTYKRFKDWQSRGSCDAHICDECTEAQPVFMCNTDPVDGHCEVDSFDRCPFCQTGPSTGPETRTEPDIHRDRVREHARATKYRPHPVAT